jgi:hypothetical protein
MRHLAIAAVPDDGKAKIILPEYSFPLAARRLDAFRIALRRIFSAATRLSARQATNAFYRSGDARYPRSQALWVTVLALFSGVCAPAR